MKISELFKRDVTRNIPPVVYFNQTAPDTVQKEVDEYIVTGGYEDGDHRKRRVERGIHEEYVRLLRGILREVKNWSGAEPAAWISGFYGSGKSGFAKMLGLALDSPKLEDGRDFAQAWLDRNQTPLRGELVALWEELQSLIEPATVLFDIGGTAREAEPIHIAILRQTLARFNYAVKDERAGVFELQLEADGLFDDYEEAYLEMFGEPWSDGRNQMLALHNMSAVMHKVRPEVYRDPMALSMMLGRENAFKMGPDEVRAWLAHILDTRAAGRTLFIVVDEMSQYVIGHNDRMTQLQSFCSSLTEQRGRIWLLATGQQKLEEQDASTELGKMKGRFPQPLRVHLGEQNIRDVVHRRLLEKSHAGEEQLRQLFEKNKTNLKLYAYDCDDITEDDFVEVYPLLPGHINLLLDITTQLRHRSNRMQGDSHGVRGLMQLLGDLFRERKLADRDLGELVRFDDVYDIQAESLDVDTRATMDKVTHWAADKQYAFALSVAKVVALLQLIQEQQPTTLEFVTQCLYDRVDRGPTLKDDVHAALNAMREANPPLVSYSERRGFRLESSARAEWNAERDTISVSSETIFEAIKDRMTYLLDIPDRPKLQGVQLQYDAWMTDSRGHQDVSLKQPRGQAGAPIDFRLLASADRSPTTWQNRSDEEHHRDRLIWLAGDVESIDNAARRWARSRAMVKRYESRRESLSVEKQQILVQEQHEAETAAERLRSVISDALMSGAFYFRGREIEPREMGDTFATTLEKTLTSVLEDLYPHFTSLTISQSRMEQLFDPSLAGVSEDFMTGQGKLGILEMDAGEVVVKCNGSIPQQLLRAIEDGNGVSGAYLYDTFSTIPYGYNPSVIKTCLLGLLRGSKIRIRTRGGATLNSYADPGTQDLFASDRELRNSDFSPSHDDGISKKCMIQLAKLLDKEFKVDIDREIAPLSTAVFKHFPTRMGHLRGVRDLLAKAQCPTPNALERLESAIIACTSSREAQGVVMAACDSLDALTEGFTQLNAIRHDLTEVAVEEVRCLRRLMSVEANQLSELGSVGSDLSAAMQRIKTHLGTARPWQSLSELRADADLIRKHYVSTRAAELGNTGAAIEEARNRVKLRDGFQGLNADQSNEVLLPLGKVLPDTDPEATTPSLTFIRSRRGVFLNDAEAEAQARLDDFVGPFVVFEPKVTGRVIATQDALEAFLSELRTSIGEQLTQGKKVRLK